jgi:hypothetical protein
MPDSQPDQGGAYLSSPTVLLDMANLLDMAKYGAIALTNP